MFGQLQRFYPNTIARVEGAFKKYYPPFSAFAVPGELTETQIGCMVQDIQFFMDAEGRVPIENICCRVETFQVETEIQSKFQKDANKFLAACQTDGLQGVMFTGKAGTGKTHQAIAHAKKLITMGYQLIYLDAEALSSFNQKK